MICIDKKQKKQYVGNIVIPTIILECRIKTPQWRISANYSNDMQLDAKSSEMTWIVVNCLNFFFLKLSFKCSLPPSEKQFQVPYGLAKMAYI